MLYAENDFKEFASSNQLKIYSYCDFNDVILEIIGARNTAFVLFFTEKKLLRSTLFFNW